MKLAKIPFEDYYISAIYFMKSNGRYMIRLRHKITKIRFHMTYARYLMSVHLKKKLRNCDDVHHIDGNKCNDNLSNLQVIHRTKHFHLHSPGLDRRNFKEGLLQNCRFCGKQFWLTLHARNQMTRRKNKNPNSLSGEFCSALCGNTYRQNKSIRVKS